MESNNIGKMFCFQCEQTLNGHSCTQRGICGKNSQVSNIQDTLTEKLISLAIVSKEKHSKRTDALIIKGLFTTVTNVNFNEKNIKILCNEVDAEMKNYKNVAPFEIHRLWNANEDVRSLKSLILFGLKGMAAYAHHALVLGKSSRDVNDFFYKALSSISKDLSLNELLALVMETGKINLKCMELLDMANKEAYGTPEATKVGCDVKKGPFIVISGHDLYDLKLLLEQTEGRGINIYTHSEMLPAHGYPQLKKHAHLKGNFGTAWQSQQKEFKNIPAPILFTTNCLMPVGSSYKDRVFTTSIVSYPELVHIDDKKDFTPVIEKALELGGYKEDHHMTGINGGHSLTTGFGHDTVLSLSDQIVSSIKAGHISHFFLVGGCDGAASGRNYYTEFVKESPKDSLILTLACGKFRFNDLDLGEIDGFPRIMDMGQCNDAYSAIKVALGLSQAFDCSVNELPLSLVLSWYEQKAICILLTLLSLGIKNIYIGPSLPAFLSTNVLDILVKEFSLTPISTPKVDLQNILKDK